LQKSIAVAKTPIDAAQADVNAARKLGEMISNLPART